MSDSVPFIDLAAQRQRLDKELSDALSKVVEGGRYILGPEVSELEHQLGLFAGIGRALSCANGTDAILLPLMAWGVGPGDAVFVPSFTFAATAEVVALTGASPVFVDVLPDTYNMDPDSLKAAIDSVVSSGKLRPSAVIAVDLFGQPADYRRIEPIVREYELKLIADSAQSYGAELDGKSPLNWTDALSVSFYPAKPLGAYGDGGAVLCRDEGLLDVLKSLRVHGEGKSRYEYARIGLNSRLDTIQAAILLVKLTAFEAELGERNRVADRYTQKLSSVVKTPAVIDGGTSTWAQYTIEVEDRDAFRDHLKARGVPTAVYYPIPLHRQSPYAGFETAPAGLPVTERVVNDVVSLPMYPDLTNDLVDRVCEAALSFFGD